MQNLIKFLLRHGVIVLFIGLEILCFNLIIRNNHRQAEIYHKVSASMTGAMSKRMSATVNYWNLRKVNDSLRSENAILMQEMFNHDNVRLRGLAGADTARTIYAVETAHIVQNSIGQRNNYLTLDKGTQSGLKPGLGVVSESGPIGITIACTPRYTKVLSILHSNAMISASIKSKGYFGSLVWRSSNPKTMELDAIPKHARLSVGDTIVTSGYSSMFPPDIPIGILDTFWLPRGSNFFRTKVTLDVDMSSLQSAYIITNLNAGEIDTLQKMQQSE